MDPRALILAATETLIDHVEELTALDSAIGDGDHGLNMKRGALAIQARLAEGQGGGTLGEALKAAGMTCMSTIGGSSGPVFGTLLVTLAKELPSTPGPHDLWGPGTRIPALIVSPFLRGNFVVDHTQYDTTSILRTIEERYNLAPLSTRDAAVNSLSNVYDAKQYNNGG